MRDPVELESYAVRSYRYLRLSIVVVVSGLFGSVLFERTHAACWQESISAYYYTPARAVLVGALVVAGVSLVVVRGSTDWEDVLLDVAGVLAPVVAFVPTAAPATSCSSVALGPDDPAVAEAFIENNVVGFAVGGAIALLIAVLLTRRERRALTFDRSAGWGLAFSIVLLVGGLVWYGAFRASFLARAHGVAAVAMFSLVFVVMVINALSAARRYRPLYAATAGTMVVAAIGVVVGQLLVDTWRHQILWLEVLELAPFGVFWAAQTIEHWDGGVPTGDERAARAACLPGRRRARNPDHLEGSGPETDPGGNAWTS